MDLTKLIKDVLDNAADYGPDAAINPLQEEFAKHQKEPSKKVLYEHCFDFMAAVVSEEEDFVDVPPEKILAAAKDRLNRLQPHEVHEACCLADTNEILET